MIIGVDAGALSVDDERLKVGVYQITLNLLLHLCRLRPNDTFRLYTFMPIEKDILQLFGPNVENRCLWPAAGWFRLWLPLELRRHPPDVYLGLSQSIPRNAPQHSIGFVYDLAFVHYPEAYPNSEKKLLSLTRSVIQHSEKIIAISQSTKRDLVSVYNIPKDRIAVAYLGIQRWFNMTGPKHKRKSQYFLFVGALKKIKNIPRILKAYHALISKRKIDIDLLLIGGDYWLDTDINRTVKNLSLSKRVFFLGSLHNQDLPKYYRGAICLLNPSLWEGFCLPAVEAMACGCPVIGSNRGALPEIVDGAGLIVKPMSVVALERAMEKILRSPALRKKLISLGRSRSKYFAWRSFAQCVNGTIAQLGNPYRR